MYASTSQDTKTLAGRLADTRRQPQRNCQLRVGWTQNWKATHGIRASLNSQLNWFVYFDFILFGMEFVYQQKIENTQEGNLVSWGTIHRLVANQWPSSPGRLADTKTLPGMCSAFQNLPEHSPPLAERGRWVGGRGRELKKALLTFCPKRSRGAAAAVEGADNSQGELFTPTGLGWVGWSVGWNWELESETWSAAHKLSLYTPTQLAYREAGWERLLLWISEYMLQQKCGQAESLRNEAEQGCGKLVELPNCLTDA